MLVGTDHVALDIGEGAAHFLTRIENILRVEDLLRAFEKGDHLGAKEHGQVGVRMIPSLCSSVVVPPSLITSS